MASDVTCVSVAQVKIMQAGSEEVVSISDLPSHVARLVQGLGKHALVATKRQAPPSEQSPAATSSERAGNNQQSGPCRQASRTCRRKKKKQSRQSRGKAGQEDQRKMD